MKKNLPMLFILLAALMISLASCPSPAGFEAFDGSRAVTAAKPVPISPLGVSNQLHPVFSWQPMTGATKYWILVGDGPKVATSNIIVDVGNITATNFASSSINFQIGKTYYWKVKGITSGTAGAWSDVVSFTILNPYGQTETIKAGQTIPANWVIIQIFSVSNRNNLGSTTYYKIKYVGGAIYGKTETIEAYGVEHAPIPANWVIIQIFSVSNTNNLGGTTYYKIKYVGGAIYGKTETIEAYGVEHAPIPANWVIIQTYSVPNTNNLGGTTYYKIKYVGGAAG